MRQEGYYWVKIKRREDNPGWHIAFWHDNNGGDDPDWCWHSDAFDTKHYDWFFDEINETRILAPDEILKTEGSLEGLIQTVSRLAMLGIDFSYNAKSQILTYIGTGDVKIVATTGGFNFDQ
jgi:hypothetical protein